MKLGWIVVIGIACSLLFGTLYLAVQQSMRLSANDPQIQLAEDTATRFEQGGQPQVVGLAPKVNIATSLAAFLMVYDNDRQFVTGSAVLDGNNPVLPPGVLSNTTSGHENHLTWQPKGGVRIAAVVVKYNNGYVLAGRSLREVERRESTALYLVMAGWIATMIFLLGWAWWSVPARERG